MSAYNNSALKIKKTVILALFCALAYATMFVLRFKVSFLTFDAKDAIITVAGLLFGPLAALVISFMVAFIEMITVSDTALYGFIMNFASSAAFSCTCSLIYKYHKNIKGAAAGLSVAVISTTAVMMAMNLIVTPFYMHAPVRDVANMIPTLLLPFNLTKSILNASLVLILYKPVSRAMKAAKVLREEPSENDQTDAAIVRKRKLTSVAVTLIGVALVILSAVVFIVLLNGEFALYN